MARVVDTLMLARRKHPSGPNSLDALCKRYGIDNSKRIKHGALMDSTLLAIVYVELLGERQSALSLVASDVGLRNTKASGKKPTAPVRPRPLPPRLTPDLEAEHRRFVESLGEKALWWRYLENIPTASD
jgi:DNA polymerase-3 subunit epsilon